MLIPHEVQMSCWITHQGNHTYLNPKPNGGENRGVDRTCLGVSKPT